MSSSTTTASHHHSHAHPPTRPLQNIITPINTQQPQPPPSTITTAPAQPPSPKAPAYSPITPKVQPILPVSNGQQPFMPPPENGGTFTFQPPSDPPQQPQQQQQQANKPAIAPTEYIPQPPSQPFSGEDATDAIALRAAISALQFQKQNASDHIKRLEKGKNQALADPTRFKEALAAGKLNEQRPRIGDLRAILDESEEGDDEDEVVLGAAEEDQDEEEETKEIPDSQPSQNASFEEKMDVDTKTTSKPSFPRIPGPQNVVRMPYINWEKYHVVGEPLEALHEQQKRWPGSTPFAPDKGREHTVAAPYSPFLDHLDAQTPGAEGVRKDSAANSSSPAATVSEHPMETRKRS